MDEQTRISVTGDEKVGWIIDIHDGDKQGVYTPEGKTAIAAITAALKEHEGEVKATGKPDEKTEDKPAEKPADPPKPPPPPPAQPHQPAARAGTKAG